MKNYLNQYSPYIYAILRIVAGLFFAFHGSQKLFGVPASGKPPMPLSAFMAFGGTLELVCGLLIAFGLFAGLAAFIASGEMAVAYFMFHAPNGGFLPIQNGGEPAALYSFLFLYIAARGSGILSLDSLIWRNNVAPRTTSEQYS